MWFREVPPRRAQVARVFALTDRARSILEDTLVAAALVAIVAAALAHSARYADAFIDDAFITFRHAMNLMQGNGFTCNAGERIEGTSSFLAAMLATVPIFLDLDPLEFSRTVGTLAFAGCTLSAYFGVCACVRDRIGRLLGLGAAALTASTASLAFHSRTGLETVLYAFLVALALVLYLRRFLGTAEKPSSMWAVTMGVASLTRPEGPAFFLLMVGLAPLTERGRRFRPLARDLLAFAAVVLPVLVFRLWYFEAWMPNSVLAKSGTPLSLRALHSGVLIRAMGYGATHGDHGFLTAQAAAALLTACALVTASTRFAGAVVGSLVAGCAAVVIWNGMGSDWMPYQRLMIPAVVPLAVGAALGLRALLFHPEQGLLPSLGFACAVFAISVYFSSRPLPVDISPIVYPEVRDLGTKLAAERQPGDVVASDIGGVLPYFWKIRMLDIFGLCDAHLARNGRLYPGIGKSEIPYIVAHKPTFLAFTYPIGAASFFANAAFSPIRDDYYLLKWPWQHYEKKFRPITILVRKDRPRVEQLAAALDSTLVDPQVEFQRAGFGVQSEAATANRPSHRATGTTGTRLFWNGAF